MKVLSQPHPSLAGYTYTLPGKRASSEAFILYGLLGLGFMYQLVLYSSPASCRSDEGWEEAMELA